jgi:hypothetical protein
VKSGVSVAAVAANTNSDTGAVAYNPGDYFVGAKVPASRASKKVKGPSATTAAASAVPAASAGNYNLAGPGAGSFDATGGLGAGFGAGTASLLSGSYPGPGGGFGGAGGLGSMGAGAAGASASASAVGGFGGQGAGGLGSFGSLLGAGGGTSLFGGASTSDASSSSRPYPIGFSGFGRRRRQYM